MSIVKNVGKKIIKGGIETLKEGARELGETVSRERVVEQITDKPRDEGGMGDYLRKLNPNLSEEEIAKLQKSQAEGLENARAVLRNATPEHMKLPPKPKELRPYERNLREKEEREKALVNAQERQQALSLPLIVGKQRGRLGVARRPRTADFERVGERGKNIKVG
jgi:hypothetical protein